MIRLGLMLAHAFARGAIVISALQYESGKTSSAFIWASIAAVLFLLARVASAFARAMVEISLSQHVVRSALDGDLFAHPLRGRQDALVAGLYDAARFETQVVPFIVADVLAVVGVVALAVHRGEGTRLAGFAIGLALGGGMVVALRRYAWRASVRAWETKQAVLRRVLDGLEGAVELVTASAVGRFEARLIASMRASRRASWIVAFEATLIGRLPILAGIAFALVFAFALTGSPVPSQPAAWGIIAAMLAPFGGLAASAATFLETRGAVRAVDAFTKNPVRADGQTEPSNIRDIVLEGVDAAYFEPLVLERVDARISRGLTVVVGANGCGKSTLLRLMTGIVHPRSGTLTVGGVATNVASWRSVRKRLSFLSQRPYVPVDASVRDMMTFAFDLDDEACRRALERAGAWSVLEAKSSDSPLSLSVDELSAGERQRVAIARMLARDAELYLLDEPDANLDRAGIDRLCAILGELAQRATIVVAAHTPELVALADHVIELEKGHVVRDEKRARAQVTAQPREDTPA